MTSPVFTLPPPAAVSARHSVLPLRVVYGAAVVTGFLSLLMSMRANVAQAPALTVGSVAAFASFGALCAWLLTKIPLFWPLSRETRGLALLWGATVATGYALLANLAIYQRVGSPHWSLFAPLTEEPIKDLGIVAVLLLAAARPRTALDGLVVGSFVGLGFEIVENVVQSLNNAIAAAPTGHPGQWTSLAADVVHEVLRRSWTGHIVITGIAGFGIAYAMTARRRPMSHRIGVAAGLALLAFAGHLLWNSHRFGAFYVLAQFATLTFYLWLIRVGRDQEARLYVPYLGYVQQSLLDPALVQSLASGPARRAYRKSSGRGARQLQRATARLAAAVANGDAVEAHKSADALGA